MTDSLQADGKAKRQTRSLSKTNQNFAGDSNGTNEQMRGYTWSETIRNAGIFNGTRRRLMWRNRHAEEKGMCVLYNKYTRKMKMQQSGDSMGDYEMGNCEEDFFFSYCIQELCAFKC